MYNICFIGWDESTKRKHLHLIANKIRFLIPPWVNIKLLPQWKTLATFSEPLYDDIGRSGATSAVLHANETGWRLNGVTHWLWCFTIKNLCYCLIA